MHQEEAVFAPSEGKPSKLLEDKGFYMTFLLLIARMFIDTFGITKPGPEGERRAAYFIGILLALIVLVMFAALIAFLKIR